LPAIAAHARAEGGFGGDNSLAGGARTEGGQLTGGATRAPGPTVNGARREGDAGRLCAADWVGTRNSTQGDFPFSFSIEFFKFTGVKINLGKYLGTSEKDEILHGGRFENLAELLY
jgi:hypothetical protein